jgi:hypothetical protein
MCETFPPNQPEDCNIPRASIKVGWENRLRFTAFNRSYSSTAITMTTGRPCLAIITGSARSQIDQPAEVRV